MNLLLIIFSVLWTNTFSCIYLTMETIGYDKCCFWGRYMVHVFVVFYFLLEIAEDGDCHQQRCERNGVANSVHEMESLEHLLKQNKNMLRLCRCIEMQQAEAKWQCFAILQTSVHAYAQTHTFNQPREHTLSLYTHLDKRTWTYLFLPPVVGGQVRGALSVVGPSAVDTWHLLPAPWCVTLAVGSPWVTGEQSQH